MVFLSWESGKAKGTTIDRRVPERKAAGWESSTEVESSLTSSAKFCPMHAFEEISKCWGKNHQKGQAEQSSELIQG